jgi:type II secretory pathway pseudopilin PulG
MTLVELLVVVAIIGLLAVTVLPNVASTAERRRSREAARVVSSFFAKAQSRGIGRPEWAGFTIVPPSTNPTARYALDLFQANVPQIYRGESYGSNATLTGSAWKRTVGYFNGTNVETIPAARNVSTGDLIRFDGRGPWYELTDNGYGVQFRGTPGGFVAATELSGQTERNTPWPTMGVPHAYEILRQPVPNGTPYTIPDGRCIDLTWSGFGSPATFPTPGNRFTTLATKITLLFDATGRVRQIFTQNAGGSARVTVTGPVFFLVGRVDRANNDPTVASTYDGTDDSTGFNWQYGDSFWIAIDPASGLVKTAECLPVPGAINVTIPATLATALTTSQQFIRSETPLGGR